MPQASILWFNEAATLGRLSRRHLQAKGTGAGGEIKRTFCQRRHHTGTKQQSKVNPKRQLSQGNWYLTAAMTHVKGVSPGHDGRLAKIALVDKHTF